MFSIAKLIKNTSPETIIITRGLNYASDYNYYKIHIYRVKVNFSKNFIKNMTIKCTFNHSFKIIDIIFI